MIIQFDNSFKGNTDIATMLFLYIHRRSGGEFTSIHRDKLFKIANHSYSSYIDYFIRMGWIEVYHGYSAGNYSKQYRSLISLDSYSWEPTTKTGFNKLNSLSGNLSYLYSTPLTPSLSLLSPSSLSIPYVFTFLEYEMETTRRVKLDTDPKEMMLTGKLDILDMASPRFNTEHMEAHGRVYHHLQTKQDIRKHFTLDNQSVSEVDISCSHPFIAGHLVGHPIDPKTFYDDLAIMLSEITNEEITRDEAKICNMQLINAHHSHSLYREVYHHLDDYEIGRFYKKVRKLSKKHRGENSRFSIISKLEGNLMNKAREILYNQDVSFYTIHDSIGVAELNREHAKQAIIEASEIILGKNNGILIKD